MKYAFAGVLAISMSFIFIQWIWSKRKIPRGKVMYRQSDTHNFLKEFFSRDITSKIKKSQITERKDRQSTKIIVTEDDKAYWVIDNMFYVSNVLDGRPDFDNAMPIDTTNMSKKELDKMLFILDNLTRGDKNERGSTGNE